MTNSIYALILAGGSGERFWPLSRRHRPKQLLSLFSEKTLLENTIDRLSGLVEPERILILTNRDQEAMTRQILSFLPPENIVAEPAKRDTAAAIALGAGWVAQRDADATMIVLPADHIIQDAAGFQNTLRTAAETADRTGDIVTIGIQPSWACPGFGYVELGKPLPDTAPPVYEVSSFREKPDPETAAQYLASGNYRWNAGMFVWSVPTIMAALEQHTPELFQFAQALGSASDLPAYLDETFAGLPKISVDYAVMEKAERVLCVEAAFDWDDVGSWLALSPYLEAKGDGNVSNTSVSLQDASGNIVYSDQPRRVVLMGVQDLIVVQTEDALLICPRDRAERIKEIVRDLPAELQ